MEFILALDNIRSILNVGAIIRSCSFFGIKTVILLGYSGKTTNLYSGKLEISEKIGKTALGAEKDLQIISLDNSQKLIDFAQKKQFTLTAIELNKNSIPLNKWKPRTNTILVLGHERDGVNKYLLKKAESIVEIPRIGTHKSLNVATTAGIILSYVTLCLEEN